MHDASLQFEASLARLAVTAVLLLTALAGLSAIAMYAWHLYRVVEIDR